MLEWLAFSVTIGAVWAYSRGMVTYGNWVQVASSLLWLTYLVPREEWALTALDVVLIWLAAVALWRRYQ